jgi:Transposase DDE domain group 1
MTHSSASLTFQATPFSPDLSQHALLSAAHQFAQDLGFFDAISQSISLKMKKIDYSWLDKLKTLWASLVIGCDHTVQINHSLGDHEPALAQLFGLTRFPDQSQVNRLLHSLDPAHLELWRKLHLDLLCSHSRSRDRQHWLRLTNGHRLLAVDLDQPAMTVSSKHFELSSKGYFGKKRGRYGYQLTLAFIGGDLGEVLDEYLDPGNTPFAHRLPDLLNSLKLFCTRTGIKPSQILLRADAQLGTPANLRLIQDCGFHFLIKGLSSARAKKLHQQVSPQSIYYRVQNGAEREPAWLCDAGLLTHQEGSKKARSKQEKITVQCRTLLLARQMLKHPSKRIPPEQHTGTDQCVRITCFDYFLTDLNNKQLPPELLLPTYYQRSTIERYFYDECYALGARQICTHNFPGAALFQFLVATTNNLLHWMKHELFKGTPLENMGISTTVHQAMQIPGRLLKTATGWIVELPSRHYLLKKLLRRWNSLELKIEDAQPDLIKFNPHRSGG